jgi:TolA-binding protein
MKRLPCEPVRLVDLGHDDGTTEVARLVLSAVGPPKDAVPKLKSRIRCSLQRKAAWRRRRLRVAILVAIVFLSGGVVGAVTQPILHLWQRHEMRSATNMGPTPQARALQRRRVSSPPPARSDDGALVASEPTAEPPTQPESTPAELSPARAPVAAAAASPARPIAPSSQTVRGPTSTERAPRRLAMLEPPPVAAPSPLATGTPGPERPALAPTPTVPELRVPPTPSEQAILASAIRALRSEHHPATALAALEEYLRRFPNGSLQPEASRLRTEALLALGQKQAALVELNQVPVAGVPGGEESHLVRGELRAAAGDWREALHDFDLVVRARLGHEAAPGAATSAKQRDRFERALWDRASARSHLGDSAGARADLRECLRRFPEGRFAAQIAALLDERR